MPAALSFVTASTVAWVSRQSDGPPGPPGTQQFGGVNGWQPGLFCDGASTASRLAVQVSRPHERLGLQLAPPSVARIAYVGPVKPVSSSVRPASVAAVGVPPFGGTIVAVSSAPAADPFVSPVVSGRISIPGVQALSLPVAVAGSLGNIAAPKRASGPSAVMRLLTTVRTVSHLLFWRMLPE